MLLDYFVKGASKMWWFIFPIDIWLISLLTIKIIYTLYILHIIIILIIILHCGKFMLWNNKTTYALVPLKDCVSNGTWTLVII